jgi:hypothetical protein
MAEALYLAELEAWVPATRSVTTLRYASGRGFVTGAGETPASTWYDARLRQPADIGRHLFRRGRTTGRSEVSQGELVLVNPDGALDALLEYGLSGRSAVIRRGAPGAAYPSGFATLFAGTMEQVEARGDTLVIRLRDRMADLDRPFQSTRFAGDNVLPDGLEGTASDLQGKPKPVCLGVALNCPVPCVNTAKLIYQLSDGLVASLDAAYDSGVPLLAAFPLVDRASGLGLNIVNGVTYGRGLYLACDAAGVLVTSPDGLTWTSRTTGLGAVPLYDVAASDTLYLVGGAAGALATSTDGVTWTSRASGFGSDGVQGIAWGGGLYVLVGGSGKIATSPDGVTWTARTSGVSTRLTRVVYANGRFVAVGDFGVIVTSTDGVTWTSVTSTLASNSIRGVGYGAGLFLAVGNGGALATSPDGVTWTSRTSGTTNLLSGVAWMPGAGYAVVGNAGTALTSTDGVTWTPVTSGLATTQQLYAVVAGDGRFLVGGTGQLGLSTVGAAYATREDLLDDTLAPAPGTVRPYYSAAGSYMRLGAPPAGQVTADLTEGATAADRTTAQCWVRVLERAGKAAGDWSASDVTALDLADDGEVGLWIGEETTFAEVLDRLAETPGAWWGPDRTGVYRIQQLTAPAGTSALTITAHDVLRPLERIPVRDDSKGIPSWRTVLRYRRNHAVQPGAGAAGNGVAGSASGGLGSYNLAVSDVVLAAGTTTPRSVRDRFAEVLNVKDFGAVGDGVTDDSVAIQAALTAAGSASRARVVFPEAVYLADALTLTATDVVVDLGRATIRAVRSVVANTVLTLTGCSRVEVRGGCLDGDDKAQIGLWVTGTSSDVEIRGVEVARFTQLAGATRQAVGIEVRPGGTGTLQTRTTIVGCYIHDITAPITGVARGVYTGQDGGGANCPTYTTVRQSVFHAISPITDADGVFIDTNTSSSAYAVVEDNLFTDCYKRGVKVAAHDVWVRRNRILNSSSAPLQHGISLYGDRNVAEHNVVRGHRDLYGIEVGAAAAQVGTRVVGNDIELDSGDTVVNQDGIRLITDQSDFLVADNTIRRGRMGLMAQTVNLTNGRIGGNTVENVTATGFRPRATGATTLTNVVVEGNTVDGCADGYYFENADSLSLLGNHVANASSSKIILLAGEPVVMVGNSWQPPNQVSADRGDANVTLTVADAEVQVFATALTSGRTVTLPSSGLYNGLTYLVARTAAATGTAGLVVGSSLITLYAGGWCRVVRQDGAWALAAFGGQHNQHLAGGKVQSRNTTYGFLDFFTATDGTHTACFGLGSASGNVQFRSGAASQGFAFYDSGSTLLAGVGGDGDFTGNGGFVHTVDGWYQDNVAANQTNVELTRATGRWTAVRAGSVLGVVVHASEARTGGTLTVTVFKNTGLAGAAGSTIGLTAVLDGTNTSRKATTQAKDSDTFAAGDELYAVVTTDGSWAPTTSDIRVALLVEC